MTKIRFIHTADLHLDTPFKGLSGLNHALADKLKDATFKTFKNIVDLCIEKKVDFLIIAGDIFDSEIKSLKAQIKFIAELKRLSAQGIAIYFNCGNHDFLSSWLDIIHFPENVNRFGSKLECFTYNKNDLPIADIYGISFDRKVVNENLALGYKRKKNPSPFSIAVYHGTIGPAGPHQNYASFQLSDIQNEYFDYWALGHIHKKMVVNAYQPALVYPGNPQGRDFGETGAKGCYLVEIEAGQKPVLEFVPLQVIRFEKIEIDLTGLESIDKLTGAISSAITVIEEYKEQVSYIIRITLKGRTLLHSHLKAPGDVEELRLSLNEDKLNDTYFVWIDRIILQTRPDIDIQQMKNGNDFSSELLSVFDSYEDDPIRLKELINEIAQDFGSMSVKKELNPFTEMEEKELLEKAKWILVDQLLKTEQ